MAVTYPFVDYDQELSAFGFGDAFLGTRLNNAICVDVAFDYCIITTSIFESDCFVSVERGVVAAQI